jgi:hypothetical protein
MASAHRMTVHRDSKRSAASPPRLPLIREILGYKGSMIRSRNRPITLLVGTSLAQATGCRVAPLTDEAIPRPATEAPTPGAGPTDPRSALGSHDVGRWDGDFYLTKRPQDTRREASKGEGNAFPGAAIVVNLY